MSTSNSLQSPHTQERQQLQGSGEGKAAQRPQALLALPQCQEAHAHAGVQQLLQFFGYEWWVHVNKEQGQEAHAHAEVQQLLQFFGYELWVHVKKREVQAP